MSYLNAQPSSYAIKFHGSSFSRVGVPDILYWRDGVPYAFEVKVIGNTTSKIQKHEIAKMTQAGVKAYVVHNVMEVKDMLRVNGVEI